MAGEDGGGDSEGWEGAEWEEAQEAGYLCQGNVHVQLCMPSQPAALLPRYWLVG